MLPGQQTSPPMGHSSLFEQARRHTHTGRTPPSHFAISLGSVTAWLYVLMQTRSMPGSQRYFGSSDGLVLQNCDSPVRISPLEQAPSPTAATVKSQMTARA